MTKILDGLFPQWRIALAVLAIVGLVGSAAYFYHWGGEAKENEHAADTLKETNDAIHDRAKADNDANRASDSELINGVRPDSR